MNKIEVAINYSPTAKFFLIPLSISAFDYLKKLSPKKAKSVEICNTFSQQMNLLSLLYEK